MKAMGNGRMRLTPKTAVQKYIVKAAGIKTLCTAKKDYASDSIARQMISSVSSFV